jgi:hypothetical protein
MPKFKATCALAIAILFAGSQLALAEKKRPSSNQTSHVTTQKAAKSSGASSRNHTANGQHIPETSLRAKKNTDKDFGCMLFPSTCPVKK